MMARAPHLAADTRQNATTGGIYAPRVFNARSRQRFRADRTAELIRHIGREPSYPERIVIARIISLEWDARRLDARLDAGEELSGHALRARLAAENRLRLDLQALGMKPVAAQPPSITEHFARKRAEQDAAA